MTVEVSVAVVARDSDLIFKEMLWDGVTLYVGLYSRLCITLAACRIFSYDILNKTEFASRDLIAPVDYQCMIVSCRK
jgi:hypothetical protein